MISFHKKYVMNKLNFVKFVVENCIQKIKKFLNSIVLRNVNLIFWSMNYQMKQIWLLKLRKNKPNNNNNLQLLIMHRLLEN